MTESKYSQIADLKTDRRRFLQISSILGLSVVSLRVLAMHPSILSGKIKAVAFDGFPIFDPRSVLAAANSIYPGVQDLGQTWFTKIFAYTWLRTSGKRYTNFLQVAEQALDHTIAARGLTMTNDRRAELMGTWMELKLWPDVFEALEALATQGIHLTFLSNLTEEMLRTNARANGIESAFEYLSTDRVSAFKPDPRAYQMGVDLFNLPKEEIAFCAFAAWDAAGASWFGYPTVWVNRLQQEAERLNQRDVIEGKDLGTLINLVYQ